MYTRNDYITGQCTHEQFYGQFVTAPILHYVQLKIGLEAIVNSKDDAFNDILLEKWDEAGLAIRSCRMTMKLDDADNSVSTGVCIAKEAARQIKERALTPISLTK
jgi:hypothetical protein